MGHREIKAAIARQRKRDKIIRYGSPLEIALWDLAESRRIRLNHEELHRLMANLDFLLGLDPDEFDKLKKLHQNEKGVQQT